MFIFQLDLLISRIILFGWFFFFMANWFLWGHLVKLKIKLLTLKKKNTNKTKDKLLPQPTTPSVLIFPRAAKILHWCTTARLSFHPLTYRLRELLLANKCSSVLNSLFFFINRYEVKFEDLLHVFLSNQLNLFP